MVSPYYAPAEGRRCSDRNVAHYSPYYMDNRTASYADHVNPKPLLVNTGDDRGEPVTARKRISVACTRCRKRKIRCSGDNGTGDSCDGCKASGNEPCLFLRVSSTEVAAKGNGFHYNLETSRVFQARGSFYPPVAPGHTASAVAAPIPSYTQAFGVYGSMESLPCRSNAPSPFPGPGPRTYYPAIPAIPDYNTAGGHDGQAMECAAYLPPPTAPAYHSTSAQDHATIPGYRLVPTREGSYSSLYPDSQHSSGYMDRQSRHDGLPSVSVRTTDGANLPGGVPVLASSVIRPKGGVSNTIEDQQPLDSPGICESVSSDYIKTSRSSPVQISPSGSASEMTTRSSSLASSPETSASAYSTPYTAHDRLSQSGELYVLSNSSSSGVYTFSGSTDRLQTPPSVSGTIDPFSYDSPGYHPDRTFECREGPNGTVVVSRRSSDGHYKTGTTLRT